MNNLSAAGQFLELWFDSNGHFVRIDLHSKSVTTAFTDWFKRHVDTVQVEIASGVFHFIEPDGHSWVSRAVPLIAHTQGGVCNEPAAEAYTR